MRETESDTFGETKYLKDSLEVEKCLETLLGQINNCTNYSIAYNAEVVAFQIN